MKKLIFLETDLFRNRFKSGKNMIKIIENNEWKLVRSKCYNYNFNKKTGLFVRWGKDKNDDPQCAPSPEILDIEISTICNGGCPFCYKSNTTNGKNMSLETFKNILHKICGASVTIETDTGKIELDPNSRVILMSGQVMMAEELEEGDEIKYINEKDIIPKRSEK